MSAHKKLIGIGAGFFVAFMCLAHGLDGVIGVIVAHAQSTSISGDNSLAASLLKNVQFGMSFILTAINFLMWVFFSALDIVMRPEFIFAGDLMGRINVVWRLCRDLVNVCFALALVGGAVWGTVTANTEKLKAAMPKFVIGVILVNFSWFIPRVIFDVSQIMTATAYQIPSLVPGGATCYLPNQNTGQYEPCQQVSQVAFMDDTNTIIDGQNGWMCPLWHLVCVRFQPMNAASGTTQSGVLNGLVVNYGRLRSLIYARNPDVAALNANSSIPADIVYTVMVLFEMVLILAIHIALFFPILALVIAFFIRIPILWVTMAFMPFVVLAYVFGDKIPEPLNPIKKIQDEFIKAVFLPVFVAVPLSIGFVLLNVASLATPPGGIPGLQTGLPIIAGVETYWQLVWLLMGLFVLWAGVFGALKSSSKIIAGVAGKIESYGHNLGTTALKAPLDLKFIPGQSGQKSVMDAYKSSPFNVNKYIKDVDANKVGGGVSTAAYSAGETVYKSNVAVYANPNDPKAGEHTAKLLAAIKAKDSKAEKYGDEKLLESLTFHMHLEGKAKDDLLASLKTMRAKQSSAPQP